MILAPENVGNGGRRDSYAVLSMTGIGSKERQIRGDLLGSLDVNDESAPRPGYGR